jgi:hypothetical protein
MSELDARSLDKADQTMEFAHGKTDTVTVVGSTWVRSIFQAGWRWSEAVGPLVGSRTCPTHHVGYAVAGHLHVRTNDGSEQDIRGGDAYNIPPGHDGWVVGDEPYVSIEFRGTNGHPVN